MPSIRPSLVGVVILCVISGATAQQAPGPSAPTIRTTTRLVQASCVVQGKGTASLPGLTPADFRLFDKGVEQQIAALSVGWVDGPLPEIASPEEGTYSNRSGLGDEFSPSATAILVEHNNLPNMDEQHVRTHLLKFLATLRPWERVALYTLEDGLRVLHDFSNDPVQLQRALESYTPPKKKRNPFDSHPWLLFRWPDAPQSFREYQRQLVSAAERRWALFSLDAIEAIARRMASFQGRKNLVWLSGGVKFELPGNLKEKRRQDPFEARVATLARTLQEANISVYPVTSRTMEMRFYIDEVFETPGGSGIYDPMTSRVTTTMGYDLVHYAGWNEDYLAQRTGGHNFLLTNNIFGALRRVLDDSRRTYVLAFYPNHGKWDGSFRKLKVKLIDKRGWKLRCRQGYYALADAPITRDDLLIELTGAAASPLEATGLAVQVHPSLSETDSGLHFEARIHLAAHDLVFDLDDEWWKGRLAVLVVQRDYAGRMLANQGDIFDVSVPEGAFDAMQTQGLRFRIKVKVEPWSDSVRIIVKDSRGGKLGSVSMPVSGLPRRK